MTRPATRSRSSNQRADDASQPAGPAVVESSGGVAAPPVQYCQLARKLGLRDAVFIGLGSMIGAGIFSAIAPAAGAAGSWLLVSLAIAAAVAFCNALSSAQLAAVYPAAGGTYVYGRQRLGHFWVTWRVGVSSSAKSRVAPPWH